VVLATRAGWAPVSRTARCLAEQTVAGSIELVLVSFAGTVTDEPPEGIDRLAAHQLITTSTARSVAEANAVGARAATAAVVAFGEDHAFPQPGWAAALLARHEEPWAVVGPVVRNANPGTAVSWADFLLGYGPFAEGGTGGEAAAAPGHNSSYKRSVLARQGAGLPLALAAEWVFHARLRGEGERIYIEPRAVVEHVNFGRVRPYLAVTFRAARAGAATRADGWAASRRLMYTAGSALLPPLRLVRTLRSLPASQRHLLPRRALAVLLVGLVVDAAGQAAGFARGGSGAVHTSLVDLELERLRHVPAADAAALR
jgi:hypothetical protein